MNWTGDASARWKRVGSRKGMSFDYSAFRQTTGHQKYMSTLIEQIKADQLTARKARQKTAASILTTLIGEAEAIGKKADNRAPTNQEVLATIKKFIKGIDEVLTHSIKDELATKEKQILEGYLPKQMEIPELQDKISEIIKENHYQMKQMGMVMKELKEKYNGLYDGKVAMEHVKIMMEIINGN